MARNIAGNKDAKHRSYWKDSEPAIDTATHTNPYGLGYWDALYAKRLNLTNDIVLPRVVSKGQQAEYDAGYKKFIDKWKADQLIKLLENTPNGH